MQRSSNMFATMTRAAVAAMFLLVASSSAHAAMITFGTTGSGSDGSLAASAVFTTSAGQVQIVLSNDLATNVIRSAGQAVSDISFTLSNAAGTVGSVSASGQLGNISGTGVVTYTGGSPTRWLGQGGGDFDVTGSTVSLEAIGGGQPNVMIAPAIGNGGTYTNTNNGFPNFNPYVIGPATFVLALSGVTATTTITAVTFSFGTGPDTFLTGSCTAGCTSSGAGAGGGSGAGAGGGSGAGQTVPEPATLTLMGLALAGAAYRARQRA